MASDDRRPVAGDVFSKRETILLAAAATTVVALLTVVLWRVTLDDAFITFRYARHLAEGYGLGAWNHTGEHVEGYSSLLWTLLLGGAAWLGVDVRIASKVFGIAASLTVIAMLFRRRDDRPAVLTGVFLALYLPLAFYAASGMEAVAFTSLVTLALLGPARWQPVVAPLLVAMRPEGALVAGVDVLALAWRRERWRWVAATAIAGGLTLLAIAVHRWMAYGALAPNTYYAKVAGGGIGHVRLGLVYVGGWMLAHAVVVTFLVVGAVAVRRAGDRRGLTCLALFVAYVVYMASAGEDPPTAFPVWRQFIHVAPAWLLVGIQGRRRVPPAALEESRQRHLPTRNDRPIFRVLVRGNADGHDLLRLPIEKTELVKVIVKPSHRVLDGHVEVPEGVPLRNLEPTPDEGVCSAENNEELVHQLRPRSAFRGLASNRPHLGHSTLPQIVPTSLEQLMRCVGNGESVAK
jgi:hypothetical protein